MTAQPTTPDPAREKTGIPKNPGRRDLGLKATLLFPDREIVAYALGEDGPVTPSHEEAHP